MHCRYIIPKFLKISSYRSTKKAAELYQKLRMIKRHVVLEMKKQRVTVGFLDSWYWHWQIIFSIPDTGDNIVAKKVVGLLLK